MHHVTWSSESSINIETLLRFSREQTPDEAFESCLRAVQIFPVNIFFPDLCSLNMLCEKEICIEYTSCTLILILYASYWMVSCWYGCGDNLLAVKELVSLHFFGWGRKGRVDIFLHFTKVVDLVFSCLISKNKISYGCCLLFS